MLDVLQEIRKLEGISGLSKHEQLVRGIINAINDKVICKGHMLPPIIYLVKELGFSRETIAKAYKDLAGRGIIASENRMGFYVADEDMGKYLRVALIIYAFDSFQEVFYKTFRNQLGEDIHIDIFFHHNNIGIFENIITNARGKYGMYVVAPIPHNRTAAILQTLPMSQFLMIDRYQPIGGVFSSITQEFEESSFEVFKQLEGTIRRYKGMVYYYQPASDTPVEILNAYKKFIKAYKVKGIIRTEYIPGSIEKGYVYFTINNTVLWVMLKDCIAKGLVLGKDVGILSHNDDLVKEIICNGITTYYADFKKMAERAARFVLDRQPVNEIIPTVLVRRNSL